jgi:hypothetical protein
MDIGTVAKQFRFWEYLFPIFGIGSFCAAPKCIAALYQSELPMGKFNFQSMCNLKLNAVLNRRGREFSVWYSEKSLNKRIAENTLSLLNE